MIDEVLVMLMNEIDKLKAKFEEKRQKRLKNLEKKQKREKENPF